MNELLERFRTWWAGLAERERQMLSAGSVVAGLTLFYLVVWEPLTLLRAERERTLADQRILAEQLEIVGADVRRFSGAAQQPASNGQSLLAVVDQSVKTSQLGKTPSRMQPEGDKTVKLWLEDVPFDAAVRWLHALQTRHAVNVDNADIEAQSEPGRVNVRVTLVRG